MLHDTDASDENTGAGTFTVYGEPRYGRTPLWIFELCRDNQLSTTSGMLYGWLMLRYSQLDRGVFPSHVVLGEEIGATARTVRRCLDELRACGAIDWQRSVYGKTGAQTTNNYVLAYIEPGNFGMNWDRNRVVVVSSEGRTKMSRAPRTSVSTSPGQKCPTNRKKEVSKTEVEKNLSAPTADAADTGDGFGTELLPIFDSPAVSASKPTKPKGAGDETEAARKRLASQLVAAYIDALPSNQGRGEGEASRAPASVSRAIGSAAKRLTIDGGYADSEFLAAFERAGRANRLDVAKFLTDPELGSSRGTYREEAQSRRHAQWAADAAALASESTWTTGHAQIGTSGRTGQMQHHSAPALTTTPWERS